jgi:hypothetical protein
MSFTKRARTAVVGGIAAAGLGAALTACGSSAATANGERHQH